MQLSHVSSQEALYKNIKRELISIANREQDVAIALSKARESKKK